MLVPLLASVERLHDQPPPVGRRYTSGQRSECLLQIRSAALAVAPHLRDQPIAWRESENVQGVPEGSPADDPLRRTPHINDEQLLVKRGRLALPSVVGHRLIRADQSSRLNRNQLYQRRADPAPGKRALTTHLGYGQGDRRPHPKWIAAQIGHANPALTVEVYEQVAIRRYLDEEAV